MHLTERRKQFLRSVVDLYRRTQLPVHYATLANRLGVSKWTAYDVLRALEEQGLLTRDYTVNRGEAGRSQIVFVPTKAAEALFAQARTGVPSQDELDAIKDEALRFLQQLKDLKPARATQRIMAEIRKIDVQVTFCAYIMGLFLVHLRTLDEGTVALVRRLVQQTPGMEMRLTVFVGIVAGMAIQSMGDGLGEELIGLLGCYLQSVIDLTDQEKEMLVSFLHDGLAEQWPAAG
ncbi:MAG: Lrp/AsnC family transcriptional regulator [Firmicutes bacterium]|nr:Lrp/AsnC family transcriptional regulator [Bacillota bacterium]